MDTFTKLPDNIVKEMDELKHAPHTALQFEQNTSEFHFPKAAFVVIALFTVGVSAFAGYSFLISPKVKAYSVIKSIKTRGDDAFKAVSAVHSSMKSIEKKATADITIEPSHSTYEHGSAIHAELAQVEANSYVLGASTIAPGKGFLEESVEQAQQEIQTALRQMKPGRNVAGAETAFQQQYIAATKDLKRTAIQSTDLIITAQTAITNLQASAKESDSSVQEATSKISLITGKADPYFTEALKISRYYERITDLVLTMNTKVRSFTISLASAATSMAAIGQEDITIDEAKAAMTQSQQHLLEADRHAKELTELLDSLKTLSPDALPSGSEEFHAHNIAVLSVINKYFAGTTQVMHTFIDSTNALLAKVTTGALTQADVVAYERTIDSGMKQAETLDAQFIAEFQSRLGEEKMITELFWDDTQILRDGENLLNEMNAYRASVEVMSDKNRVTFFTN